MNNGIRIRNIEPQEITIEGATTVAGITNVYVNGVDVTVGTKAYVIVPTKTSELTNDSGFITSYTETDPTVPAYVKAISLADINAWNDKQNLLVSGVNIKTINNNSLLGSGDIQITATEYEAGTGIDITGNTISNTITSYQDLTDLPTIPTTTGELINTSGFINNTVNDLTNYIRADLLEDILPSVSDSGTELYLQDTAPYTLHLKLDPSELEQHTTTGKNIFNTLINKSAGYTITINGVTETYNSDGSITFVGTSTAQSDFYITTNSYPSTDTIIDLDTTKPYTLSLVGNTDNNIRISIGYSTTAYHANSSTTFTPTTDIAWAFIRISNGATLNTTIYPQLEEGSTATSYEEYTGGFPSPNPDYPQDIHTITGENSVTIGNKNQCNLLELDPKIYIGGLPYGDSTSIIIDEFDSNNIKFHADTAQYNEVLSNIIQLKPSTQYTIKFSRTSTATNNQWFIYDYDNGVYSINFRDNNTNTLEKTFTTNSVGQIALAWGYGNVTGITTVSNIQLERGSTATSYIPHEERIYPIELDNIELNKITTQWGDYENFIFKNSLDSPWYDSNYTVNSYVYGSRVFKYTLSSDDNWELLPTGVFSAPVNYTQLGTTKHYAVCNYFQDYNDVNDPTTDSWIMTQGNSVILHFNSSLNINTVSDLQTWLDNNEVVFYAIRGGLGDYNSYNQAIEYSLQNQWFNAANSIGYDGGTVITQENFDRPFDLSAKTIQKVTN